ncbi:hypothetical protein CY35_19G065200 [Sphagnum magellanicum]|nr:hypothetical protein CY35_19G065200 [Sphagnum magellanicum]
MIFKRTRACKRTAVTTPAAAQDQRYNSRLLTRLFAACRDDSYFAFSCYYGCSVCFFLLEKERKPLLDGGAVRSRRRVRCSLLFRMASSALSPASPSSSPAAAASSSTSPVQSDAAIPPFMKAISGSLGGMVEAGCLQPIDVIKTRLQLDHNKQYKGIWNCGTTIVQQEGVRALWKGLTPFATHLTLKYTLRMGSNAVLQSALADPQTGEISTVGRLTAGFGAGVLEALAIVTPFEVVKIRLQQQKGVGRELLRYKGPVHCASTIIREEGILGLWAGFAGPVCTGPFDVVKTRLMAQSSTDIRYKGLVHAFSRIYTEEGLFALWKGLVPRLMRIPPGQAIMWTVADQVIGLYERKFIKPTKVNELA